MMYASLYLEYRKIEAALDVVDVNPNKVTFDFFTRKRKFEELTPFTPKGVNLQLSDEVKGVP